jgi:hypothetical protein
MKFKDLPIDLRKNIIDNFMDIEKEIAEKEKKEFNYTRVELEEFVKHQNINYKYDGHNKCYIWNYEYMEMEG